MQSDIIRITVCVRELGAAMSGDALTMSRILLLTDV
jgi:hypothetical protein